MLMFRNLVFRQSPEGQIKPYRYFNKRLHLLPCEFSLIFMPLKLQFLSGRIKPTPFRSNVLPFKPGLVCPGGFKP